MIGILICLTRLAAVRPGGLTGLPSSSLGGPVANTTSAPDATGYSLPQPDSTGSLNISGANPVNAGSVSIADAIAKARGIAAEKGISYNPSQGKYCTILSLAASAADEHLL